MSSHFEWLSMVTPLGVRRLSVALRELTGAFSSESEDAEEVSSRSAYPSFARRLARHAVISVLPMGRKKRG